MTSRYKFSLTAVIMLVLLGFVFQNHEAKGQEFRGALCPLVDYTTGYTDIELSNPAGARPADFSAGVLGTLEPMDGVRLVAGMDWMHAEIFVDYFGGYEVRGPLSGLGDFGKLPTTVTGSQNVAPYNQKNDRNTYIQLTNSADKIFNDFLIPPVEVPVTVHVQVFDENCNEIVNFCDDYTGFDTHEYDLSNFVANDGQDIPDLNDGEGFVVMTPVKNCDSNNPAFPETAIDHNYFAGEFMIHDGPIGEYRYGAHTYARQSVCEPPRRCCPVDDTSCIKERGGRSGCEFDPRDLTDQEIEFCAAEGIAPDDHLSCVQLLSAYICEIDKFVELPSESADDKPYLPGICVPNEFHQGRPCVQVPILDFCGIGAGKLPNGQCVLNPGEAISGTCMIEEFCESDEFGRGCLTGSQFAQFERVRPDTLYGQFNVLPQNSEAGSDLVLIDFADQYIPFNVLPGYVAIDKNIHNDVEEAFSCGTDQVCYARYGIDLPIGISEEFTPPTLPPTATPTQGPTAPPTDPPTPTPDPTRKPGGGSSSCAIAGNPVQLGTALANVLIPLVPVAFAFGVRAVRRRKK